VTETELLTPKECAQYRRCSVRKLDRERAEGRGCPHVRIDGRIFYRRSDIERFISAHVCGGELRGSGIATERPIRRHNRPRGSGGTVVEPSA